MRTAALYIYIYIYSVSFFLHNCPLLIPLHNTAVLIKICNFVFNNVDSKATYFNENCCIM